MDSKETTLFIAIVISGVIIGFFIVFFIVSIIRQQRRILELSRRNILAEITAMEKERGRIANDLHDDLGPIMSVTKFEVDNLTVEDEEEKQLQQQALTHLDGMLTRIREISNDLMPQSLLRKGLWASLLEFGQRVERSSHLQMQVTLDATPALPQEVEINIYRVLQEVVHNIIKHAEATDIQVKAEEAERQLVITCRDNGKGFDYEKKLKEGQGLGLKSIRSRAVLIKGSLVVQSRIGKGTAYRLSLPLSQKDRSLN